MPSLGWPEMVIIGLAVILLFGTKKLPEAAKVGQGIKNFKQAMKGEAEEIKKSTEDIKKEVEKV